MKKLKKLALTVVATSSLLNVSAFAADNQFYLTAGGGVLFSDKQLSDFNNSYTNNGVEVANKFTFKKPKTSGEMFVGVGYYVTDKIRAEANFVKPWFGKENITQASTLTPGGANSYKGKLTSQVNSAQVKGYYDAFDISDMGKAYVGAGLGWSQIKAKFNTKDLAVNTVKTKNKSTFAWTLAVGAAFDVVDEVKLGLEYNYQDFGHVKNPLVAPSGSTNQNGNNVGKVTFHGHAIVAKLMFNI
jgi:opacity protein-like surface antigen